MSRPLHIAAWPLVVKVPVLVAGLMVTVAFTISQVVLWRFMQDQENNLRLLTSAYVDGLSALILPAIVQGNVWEVFDALDRTRNRYAGVEPRYAIVELADGKSWRLPIHSGFRFTLSSQMNCSAGSARKMGFS